MKHHLIGENGVLGFLASCPIAGAHKINTLADFVRYFLDLRKSGETLGTIFTAFTIAKPPHSSAIT